MSETIAAVKLVRLDSVTGSYPVSARTVRHLIRSGELPAVKVGRAYFVDPADVARIFSLSARLPRIAEPEPATAVAASTSTFADQEREYNRVKSTGQTSLPPYPQDTDRALVGMTGDASEARARVRAMVLESLQSDGRRD